MKVYKIEFLGNKSLCLDIRNISKQERINRCNELIIFISEKDRMFFYNKGNVAKFEIINNKVVYIEQENSKILKNTYKNGKWNDGGTLRDFVMFMSIYIESGIPFFYNRMRLNNWDILRKISR